MPEPQAKVSLHIEEVPKDLEEQVKDLHAQVFATSFISLLVGALFIQELIIQQIHSDA